MNIQSLIDAQKHIIIICDKNFNLKFINKAFYDYFKEDKIKLILELLKTKPFDIDFKEKFVNYKEYKFEFEVNIKKIDDEIIVTMYDITKYSAYKKSLLSSNISFSIYKKLVDKVLIISKTDVNGIITYVNKHFIKISGYSKEELIGASHSIVRHPDMPSYVFRNMWKTIQSGKIWQGVVKNRKKNGEAYYVKTMIAPLFNENNEIKEYIAFRVDITELIKAKEKAQMAKKTKEMFLANMSHEIRTPLTGIIGFIDVLKHKNLPKDIQKIINIIDNSADTLLNVVNDILDISKMESEGVTLNIDKFDPNKSFENSVKLFEARTKEKNIKYLYKIDVGNCVISDEHRLKQVISNIIGNAIKFTPQNGEVKVNIIKSYEDDKKVKVDFSIEDSGIGIPKDKIKKLFKPFSQIDNNKTFGGTGLGLYISYQIVKKLGSEIKVKSEENKGSRFYFSLEFEKCDKMDKKFYEDINVKGKILVAEDNLVNQELMKMLLESRGDIKVDIVSNGLEAVKIYKNNKYDLIFMDIFMPIMKGDEATKNILEYEKNNNLAHTPIVALTANALKGDKEKFLKEGFDDYISKPINNEKLDDILKKYLKIDDIELSKEIDEEIMLELLGLYLEHINNDLYNLYRAIQTQNITEIRNISHKIGGSSSAVELNDVYHKAKEIEFFAQDQKDIDYKKLFNELVAKINKYRK